VVVTAPLMQHKISRGYNDPFGSVVAEIDGVKIKNLRHLIEVLRDGHGEFLTIRFCGDYSELLVFRRKAIEAATAELMSENGIPRRGSAELMAVWNAKPASQARR
jgi:PDZ domain